MKKKMLALGKIALTKEKIASLTANQKNMVRGGNSVSSTPCPGGLECATIQDTPSCRFQCR